MELIGNPICRIVWRAIHKIINQNKCFYCPLSIPPFFLVFDENVLYNNLINILLISLFFIFHL